MDFTSLQEYTSIGLEGSAVFVILVIGWKLYKMKCHSRSGCCRDKFVIETLNRAGSSSDLEFTNIRRPPTPPTPDGRKTNDIESAVI